MLKLIDKGGLYFAEADLPFKDQDKFESVKLVVDSGAALTIVDTNITDYLGYSSRDAFKTSTLDGAAGRSKGYLINVPVFRCLGFSIEEFDIACHDMNTKLGVAGILGMNFLRNFRIDVDWHTGAVFSIKRVT